MEISFPLIETERLKLRLPTPDDAENIFAIWSDPEVLKFIPIVLFKTLESIKEFIPVAQQRWKERGIGLFAVTAKENDQLIGYCGLQYLDGTPEVEIYYGFSTDYWDKGFATEAAQAVLRFAFEEKKLESIAGVTQPGNLMSQKVLEKLGLKKQEPNRMFYNTECTYFTLLKENFSPNETHYRITYV